MTNQKSAQNTNHRQTKTDGNVHIDFVPKDKDSNKKGFSGGEYVNYEDVKD